MEIKDLFPFFPSNESKEVGNESEEVGNESKEVENESEWFLIILL